jgi:hypothetical protein
MATRADLATALESSVSAVGRLVSSPVNTGDLRAKANSFGTSGSPRPSSRERDPVKPDFLAALRAHYGFDLAVSAAAILNRQELRNIAPASNERGLEAWLAASADFEQAGRDGQRRQLYRLVTAPTAYSCGNLHREAEEAGRARVLPLAA